jgi:hypothetical protein
MQKFCNELGNFAISGCHRNSFSSADTYDLLLLGCVGHEKDMSSVSVSQVLIKFGYEFT